MHHGRACVAGRELAAVPRAKGGVAPDDPALPDTWSTTQNVAWKIDIPGRRGARRSSGAITSSSRPRSTRPAKSRCGRPHEYISRSGGGTMTLPGSRDADRRRIKWVVYDVDFKTGKVRWQSEAANAVRRRRGTRRTASRRKRRSPTASASTPISATSACSRYDMNGKLVWSQNDRRRSRRAAGSGRPASPIVHDGSRLSSSTTTTSSRSSRPTTSGPARSCGACRATRRSNWSTPFVWENDAADGDRHRRHRQDPLVRPGRQAAVGAQGDVDHTPSRRRSRPRAALHQVGLSRPTSCGRRTRSAPARSGDISLKPEQTSNEFIVWSNPLLGPYNPSALVYQATATTRCSTAGS